MSPASHDVREFRRLFACRAGLTALVLLAACGGERRDTPAAGTEGAAVSDTAAAPTVAAETGDTAAQAATDTAPKPSSGTTDTAAAPGQQAQPPAAAPAAQAPKPQTPKPAAPKPAPAKPSQAAAPAQDTAKADTASAQAAAPAQDTGTTETATASEPLRDEYHRAPRDTVDQTTYDGWKQYNLNCARCHGEDVLGTTIAPHLLVSLKPNGSIPTQESFVQVVCAGRPEKGMPAWCPLGLGPDKINQIYSYVKGRSEGKIGPGRPAVKQEG